jgi:hypothetical protein
MKTRILILALLVMIAGLAYTQQAPENKTTTMEKKVLNKIRRNMSASNFREYIAEGETETYLITCLVNDENMVEIVDIKGNNKAMKADIESTLEKHPVKVSPDRAGDLFKFKLTFEHRPFDK